MERRRVIGYDKTLEYLKKGYELYKHPMYKNDYIHITNEDGKLVEIITIRYDVFGKLLMNDYKFDRRMEHYTNIYKLRQDK